MMLKISDEKVLKTEDEIEELYKNCKYLYIVDSYDKMADEDVYSYCISISNELYMNLIRERERLLLIT